MRVRLTQYDVAFCGCRALRGGRSVGNWSETVEDVAEWAQGKRLEETKTFATTRDDPNEFGVYCIDVARSDRSGDCVLVTWNETPNDGGEIASVGRNSIVGQEPRVHTFDVPQDSIVGFPTYFYLSPNQGAFHVIRLESSILGISGFVKYIQGFLTLWSRYVVYDGARGDDANIVGYGTGPDAAAQDVFPHFDARPSRGATARAELVRLRERIYKVERKIDLNFLPPPERSALLNRLLVHLGWRDAGSDAATSLKTRYVIRARPTRALLDDLLRSFDYADTNTWDDIGFYIQGRNQPIWLRKALRAEDRVLDVEVQNRAFIPAREMLEALVDAMR